MRLSHLLRPLALALYLYAGLLAYKNAKGELGRPGPDDPSRLRTWGEASVRGRVASLPEDRGGRQEFFLDAERVGESPVRGKLWVRLRGAPALAWGERVTLRGRLLRPPASRLPGLQGWGDYLKAQGAHALLDARRLEGPPQPGSRLLSGVTRFRRWMVSVFADRLRPDQAGLLGAILIGEKAGLAKPVKQVFRDAGAIHILVVSGLHVGFLLLLVTWPLRRLGVGRGAAMTLGLIAAGLFTLAAGASPPLLRAYGMALAAALGYALDRDSGIIQGLVLAAWGLLLANPASLFEPGFQLSFAATFAILAALSHWSLPDSLPKPLAWALNLFLVSLAAQIAVSPVLACAFHRVSFAALISNLVLVPFSEALMAGGLALCGAAALPWQAPAALLARLLGEGLDLFSAAAALFARLPGAACWAPQPPALLMAAYALLALSLYCCTEGAAKRLAAAGLVLLLAAGVSRLRAAPLTVGLLAGGAGAVLRSPDRTLTLLNAPASGQDLAELALAAGSRSVDTVYLTSLERPAWKGLAALAAELPVRRVVAPPGFSLAPGYASMRAELERRGVLWEAAWPGFERSGPLVFWRDWEGYSGGRRDALRLSWRCGGLRGSLSGQGAAFDWKFDIMGPFERRPRRALRIVFDGASARLES